MSCGCKEGNNFKIPEGTKASEAKISINSNDVVKWVIFLFLVLLSPIYAPIIVVYALYRGIIKTEGLDTMLMFKTLSKTASDIITKDEKEKERLSEELEELEDFEVVELEPAA